MIYLMRHGESTVNIARVIKCRQLDGDLTDKGRDQARLAGGWLKDKGITKMCASPFHRAQQSAEIVGGILDLPFETDDDLREIDCGDLEGRADPEAWDLWDAADARWGMGDWEATFAGGETLRAACDRMRRALQRGCQQNTLLVTHGGILVRVLPYIIPALVDMPNIRRLENTGIVVLEPGEEGLFTCSGWNLVEHLAIS